MKKLLLLLLLMLSGCNGVPEGLTVVDDFRLDRYLGTWHEIARLDNSFEKDLGQVSAEYALRDDGSVKVLNRGYDTKKGEWTSIEGKALFVGDPSQGALKVSFFGPFYTSYNIVALDRENYSWAIVCGYKKSLFWILARQSEMDSVLLKQLVMKADSLGFETAKLRYLKNNR
ncbi:MAG: lipocalin family protein [Chlorobium sp.]|jgi:apolipoprotein D and lipocalin family protein|uniref:lipocalin family protein n=1 Tax=Chlorobium sp. TaxID=1095 RepID=UPI001D6BA9C4|nr:lipocalin family protein [Chlorobium sp.]MBN1279667.1 lipocalin family protein [Chlorobiaceae bacterium]MCF8215921.1 lipocalin family protein [Chlorobium sp.]MCF8270819.1 lipocalin family protein [Chlorobium sp.]MCF8287131.1 lipocalin family protein [Chlorobium sp.]MCF8290788.1 lipocalin family protein [Chlorobium sp.]